MGFFEENWLWRGTQSAIFYYISCSPWIEWKYKRKRRNEANRAQKHREEVVSAQPGQIQQPGAFQTNGDWVEEILMGPGPPKGWKRDPIVGKAVPGHDKSSGGDTSRSLNGTADHCRQSRVLNVASSAQADYESLVGTRTTNTSQSFNFDSVPRPSAALTAPTASMGRHSTESTTSTLSSASEDQPHRPRPSLDRRLSTAMDNFRDTIRSTMRPEKWNWIRYERDDEILFGFNQRMTEMWNRATNFGSTEKSPSSDEALEDAQYRKRRRRADTADSDGFDYQKYTRNPEINELHPPVVSRLPVTRDEAAWMVLPPPSAAIMEGKARPQDVPTMRWPLARIGRTPEDWKTLRRPQAVERHRAGSEHTDTIPELSDSFTESASSDEETWKRSSIRRNTTRAAVISKPIELDLAYVTGGRVSQDRGEVSSSVAGPV